MRTLDLCVVADRSCATSRTYLSYLAASGYRVRKILLVDFIGPHPQSRAMATKWGRWIAWWFKRRIRRPEREYAPAFQTLCTQLQAGFDVQVDYFGPFDFARHAERVVAFAAEDYDDPDLHRMMLREGRTTFLYTNGGRVPPSLLSQPDIRILHIHPGVVPEVKGSDCLFWSLLVRGVPGMSCFYMNAGIDTGNIIRTREFHAPCFPQLAATFESDPDMAYNALLHAYDPHLRAMTLLDVIEGAHGQPLNALPAQAQQAGSGRSYFWMHPRLTRKVLRQIAGGIST
ncbi:MAG: hypothetical protein J0L51_01600 [Rhizobiales bacterium]|nr:hypothetical protein [Hyphomicrobiales bacterium]